MSEVEIETLVTRVKPMDQTLSKQSSTPINSEKGKTGKISSREGSVRSFISDHRTPNPVGVIIIAH